MGIAGAATFLAACDDLEITIPTPTPTETQTSIPTLIPATPENIVTQIPHVSILSRQVAFEDATSLLDQVRSTYISEVPKNWDSDWFVDIAEISGYRYPEPNQLFAYFDSRTERLYTGFGIQGRENDILGWDDIKIADNDRVGPAFPRSGNNTRWAFMTNTPGKFGYFVTGYKGENRKGAFVFVDMPKSRKTFIQFGRGEDNHPNYFGFDVSENERVLAINELSSQDFPEKGVYLLDTENWQLINYVHEHVNDMQISEDGNLIFSSTGPGFNSKIINATTGEVEIIDWQLDGNPSIEGWKIVLSPNFQYIAAPLDYWIDQGPYIPGGEIIEGDYKVLTPNGFKRVPREEGASGFAKPGVESISNEGTVRYRNGDVIELGK